MDEEDLDKEMTFDVGLSEKGDELAKKFEEDQEILSVLLFMRSCNICFVFVHFDYIQLLLLFFNEH